MGDDMEIPRSQSVPRAASQGRADADRLGLVGCDHVGLTVPDINQAVEWFEDVLGAEAPLSFGPIEAGSFLAGVADVAQTAAIGQITVLRIGRSANIELFEYAAPDGQRRDMPRNSDWSGNHSAFYVTEMDAAVDHMKGRCVKRMPAGPFTLTEGPAVVYSRDAINRALGRAMREIITLSWREVR